MSLRAAFESKAPNLTSSERTQNIKAKSIYTKYARISSLWQVEWSSDPEM